MKKIVALGLLFIISICFVACSKTDTQQDIVYFDESSNIEEVLQKLDNSSGFTVDIYNKDNEAYLDTRRCYVKNATSKEMFNKEGNLIYWNSYIYDEEKEYILTADYRFDTKTAIYWENMPEQLWLKSGVVFINNLLTTENCSYIISKNMLTITLDNHKYVVYDINLTKILIMPEFLFYKSFSEKSVPEV